jgi:hypothetical protein
MSLWKNRPKWNPTRFCPNLSSIFPVEKVVEKIGLLL